MRERDLIERAKVDVDAKVADLNAQLGDHELNLVALRKEISSSESRVRELETHINTSASNHTSAIGALTEHSKQLESDKSEFEGKFAAASAQRDAALRERRSCSGKWRMPAGARKELRELRDRAEREIQELKAKLQHSAEDQQMVLETLRDLTEQNAAARRERQQWELERVQLQDALSELKRQLGDSQSETLRVKEASRVPTRRGHGAA